jgi:hypothetical protein
MRSSKRIHVLVVFGAWSLVASASVVLVAATPDTASAGARLVTSVTRASALGTVGSGSASDPLCSAATLGTAQQTLEAALSNRSTQLQTLLTRISNTKDIPSADASMLDTIVSDEQTGLVDGGIEGLEAMVPRATTCAELVSDAEAMVRDFWVYALTSPQVDLTSVASTESAIVTKATALEPQIQSAITSAEQRGVSVSGAEAADSDLQAKISTAATEVQAVSISTLLSQVPSDYPGDATMLVGYYNDVVATGADLRAAGEDLHAIVDDLA